MPMTYKQVSGRVRASKFDGSRLVALRDARSGKLRRVTASEVQSHPLPPTLDDLDPAIVAWIKDGKKKV